MKITGWQITVLTDEFPTLGWVKASGPVEFGNSPIRDKQSREQYIRELLDAGKTFTVEPITD